MPTYSYACTQCDNRFDIVQSFTDDSLTECPECAGKLRKLFNSVGIVFKGSGFYRTDSRNGGSSSSEPAKSDSAKSEKSEKSESSGNSSSSDSGTKSSGASKSDSGSAGSSSSTTSTAVAS